MPPLSRSRSLRFPSSGSSVGQRRPTLSKPAQNKVPKVVAVADEQLATPCPHVEEILRIISDGLWSPKERQVRKNVERLAHLSGKESSYHENSRLVCEAGGHLAIVHVMRKFQSSMPVAMASTQCIVNLASLAEFRQQLGEIGAVDTILVAMNKFKKSLDLQRAALSALANLVADCAENARRLHHDGNNGIPVVVNTMLKYYSDTSIQGNACRLLYHFCYWPEHVPAVLEVLGASATARAYENFTDDYLVQTYAPGAMSRMMMMIMPPPTVK